MNGTIQSLRTQYEVLIEILEIAFELIGDPLYRGAYYYHCGPNGIPTCMVMIGIMSNEDEKDYFAISSENARRLFTHPEHLSSYQSRDLVGIKTGGAIRGINGGIHSLSGLTEMWNEACMLTLDLAMAGIREPTDTFRKIVSASNNTCALWLLEEWNKRHPFKEAA